MNNEDSLNNLGQFNDSFNTNISEEEPDQQTEETGVNTL